MSKILDLTQYIADPKRAAIVEGITYDEDQYFGCVVYARYRPAAKLYQSLMNPDSPDAITSLSDEEGKRKALSFASSTMVVLDSDDENDAEDEEAGKFIFSLTDAYSGQLMTIPVRGNKCKHFQVSCFQPEGRCACFATNALVVFRFDEFHLGKCVCVWESMAMPGMRKVSFLARLGTM